MCTVVVVAVVINTTIYVVTFTLSLVVVVAAGYLLLEITNEAKIFQLLCFALLHTHTHAYTHMQK